LVKKDPSTVDVFISIGKSDEKFFICIEIIYCCEIDKCILQSN